MTDPAGRRIAIVVDPGVPVGLLGNAIAVVGVGLGASTNGLGGLPLRDKAGRDFRSSATVALPVLQAPKERMIALLDTALAAPGLDAIVVFPAFARAIHDFASYRDRLAGHDLADEPLAAMGLAGETDAVKALTHGLSLLR